MKVQTGYLYHIKDEFFNVVNDDNLMTNHERGKKRPTYFTIKDGNILWFIPLSTKIEKYQGIINKKLERNGICNSILIRNIMGEDAAILLQNAFPTLEKYVKAKHTIDGKDIKVPDAIKKEIIINFRDILSLKKKGLNLFFTDIDKIKEQVLEEMNK